MRALLILSSLFIVFGSLYPFDVNLALWSMRDMARFDDHVGLADVVANVALFLPYCFAARSLPRRWLLAILGVILALVVQIAQDVIPDRSPSLWDVVTNTIGLAIGWAAAALLHGRNLTPRLSVPLFAPAVCFVIYELAPFAPTLDIGLLRAHLKLFAIGAFDPGDVLRNVAQALVLAALLALELPERTVRRLLMLLLPALAAARLIIIDNGVGPGAIAGLLAAAILALLLPLRLKASRVAALLAAIALLLWDGLTPFDWRGTPMMPALVPFAGLLSGDWLGNLVSMSWKIFLYGSVIEIGRRDLGRAAATIAIMLSIFIEGSQTVLASGTPEVTDVVLVALLAWTLPRMAHAPVAAARPKLRPRRAHR